MKKKLALITLTAGVLLAVVFLASHLHHKTEEKVLSQFNERQLLIARQTARQIESYFHSRSQDIRYLSSFTSLQHLDVKKMRTDVQANFNRLKTVHIKEILVLDAKGKIVYSTGGDAIGSRHGRSDIYAWARKPANKGMVRLAIERTDEQGAPPTGGGVKPPSSRISLVTPLYQESVADGSPGPGGKFFGIILLTIDLEKMLAERTLLFEPTKKSHTLWIWMMDEDGTLLLQSEHPSMAMKNIREKKGECNRCHVSFDYAEKIATAKQGIVEYQLKGREKKIAAFAPMTFENTSWIVVVNSPFDEVTGFIRGNFRDTLGLVGIVVVAMGFAFFSMYRTYRREVHIQEEVKHLKEKQSLMESLRETRDYLENLFNYANAPIIVWGPEFRITRFNRAFERLTGCSAGEVLGKPLDILFPPDRREEAMGHIRCTMTGERWEIVEIPILRVDGSVRTVLWNSATLYAADGTTVIATIAQGQDITERARAERDTRHRNQELSMLHAIGRTVAQSLDLQEILDSALDATLAVLRVEAGGIFLLEPDGETMTLCTHRGLSEEFVRNMRKIRMGEGVSGRAAVEKIPIVLDVAEYPTERLAPHIVREGLRTIASTPLISAGNVIGALNLGTCRSNVFPPEELQLLASIGLQLGQAVRNAQLYESVQKEVAERKQAEEVLRETRDYLENLLEYANAPIIVWDPDFRITRFNRAFERLTGRSAGEVLGNPLDILFPADRREEAMGHIHRTMTGERWESVEIPILRAGGSVRTALWNSATLYAADGTTAIATIAQGQDITERKQAEETVRDAHQRLSFHVNRMPLAYIVWDTDFKVMEWNSAAERVFGWEANEAIGKHSHELIVPADVQSHVDKVWSKLLEGDESSYSLNENFRKDGKTITCEWFNAPLRDASGNVMSVLSMVHDVTEKTQLDRQLQTAQKMESVGTLAGGIAHDFNNVLTVIIGFGEMLKRRVANDPNAVSDLDEILRAADRAAVLTRQLLTFARRQVVELVNLDLNEVMASLVKLIRKVTREDIEIKALPAKRPVMIRVDRGQIEQVLMNLCLNARDAMPKGGQLVIETGVTLLEEGYLKQYPYMKAGRYAVLSVSDTGIGMDEKTLERIFEPFFTTKGPDKGTGLGLAMVYGIVKQHNGFLHVYSELGKGSTFRVYFPEVDAPADAKVIASRGVAHGGSETILLAEDNESVRHLTEQTLISYGYRVLIACDGEEAVDIFRRHQKEISMAVLDVVMPKKGGKEAYDEMITTIPGLKALFMSGYSANAIHESFVLHPGIPFLQKPFAPGAFARKVRKVLDGE